MFYFLVIFVCLLTTILYWLKTKHSYWQRRNVETFSMKEFYCRDRPHIAFIIQKIYQKIKQENKLYMGIYSMITPSLIITDLDLIKSILINDFNTFPDRGLYFNPHNDPLSLNLVRLSGDRWRKIRQKLTPTFTSGKMKLMFTTVKEIGDQFVSTMYENMKTQNSLVEVRDLCARFTTDVIGNVAFGLQCNSLSKPHAEFRIKGDKAFYTIHPLMEMLASTYPNFFHKLGYKAFTSELIDFYSDIVRKTVKYREQHNFKRNDFLDMLIDFKNNKEDSEEDFYLEMEDVIAQAFVFFIGGFETSSSTMAFTLYELARNAEIQEKARLNIQTVLEKHNGVLNYESLNEMLYIKQVVQETLRKNPVAPTTRRVCRSSYTLPGPQAVTIDPGVQIFIPIYAIHHDADYYPEPERFLPERFESPAKDQRHSMAYLPFGAGPRICLAERFGLMQAMIGVALMLKNFRFSVCEKTPKQLNFDPANVRVFSVKEGIYLKVESVVN